MKSVDLARQYIGKQETTGTNDGPILREIRSAMLYTGAPPCSWCALFVGWILSRAYLPADTPRHLYKHELSEVLGFLRPWYIESTRDWYHSANDLGMIVSDPEPGDLFILLDAQRNPHHIGFVTADDLAARDLSLSFGTIEGNTNDVGSVNGDGVYERIRKKGPSVAFVGLPAALKA